MLRIWRRASHEDCRANEAKLQKELKAVRKVAFTLNSELREAKLDLKVAKMALARRRRGPQ